MSDKKLKKEEVEPIVGELRKILTHEGLEKLIVSHWAYREHCETQTELLRILDEKHEIQKQLISGLEEQIESEDKYSKSLQGLLQAKDNLLNSSEEVNKLKTEKVAIADERMIALEQAELHSRAMQQSADHYAIECRSMLVYVLERTERSRDWIRLWEALPQDQKDVYNQESKEWLGKQEPHVDPELRKKMLPPPQRNKGGESNA